MKILKQLDKLVIRSFIGPYIISFLVAEFVLVLQFLWRYIDDFIGRGIGLWVILKMIFYYGLTIIPLAVPISILISSVMVYGGMSEKYELTSFKSAGVSLYRIILPGLLIAIFTALFSLFASNVLKPKANLSFFQTFDNVRKAKPTLTIDEGIFNYDFKGFAIRVGKKGSNGRDISDILIYDERSRNHMNLTTAKSGQMYISDNGRYFNMILNDGYQYSEVERKSKAGRKPKDQFIRMEFETWKKSFDMGEFAFSVSNANLGRRKHDLYNTTQMIDAIDSIDITMNDLIRSSEVKLEALKGTGDELSEEEQKELKQKYLETEKNKKKPVYKDGLQVMGIEDVQKGANYYENRTNVRLSRDSINIDTMTSFKSTLKEESYKSILFRAKSQVQSEREKFRALMANVRTQKYSRNRFVLRIHQQFCWALICIVFMLIGAPLGSIVRKGGFGYPLLIAIAFFIVFIFTSILGEKLMLTDSMKPIPGAWLPLLILLPFSIYFMRKALNDSRFEFKLFGWLKSILLGWFKK